MREVRDWRILSQTALRILLIIACAAMIMGSIQAQNAYAEEAEENIKEMVNIEVNVGEHGTANARSGLFTESVEAGSDLKLLLQAEEGYLIGSVRVNGMEPDPADLSDVLGRQAAEMTIEQISADLKVEVAFAGDDEVSGETTPLEEAAEAAADITGEVGETLSDTAGEVTDSLTEDSGTSAADETADGADSDGASDDEAGGDAETGADDEAGGDDETGADAETGGDDETGGTSDDGAGEAADDETGGDDETGDEAGGDDETGAGGDDETGGSSDDEAGGDNEAAADGSSDEAATDAADEPTAELSLTDPADTPTVSGEADLSEAEESAEDSPRTGDRFPGIPALLLLASATGMALLMCLRGCMIQRRKVR